MLIKELYKLCETLNTNYVIRLKANATLYRLAKEVMDVFLEECSLQYSQQFYGEFEYQAKSWDRPRRVDRSSETKSRRTYSRLFIFSDEHRKQDRRWLSVYTLNVGRWKTISKSVKMDLEWIKSVISTG